MKSYEREQLIYKFILVIVFVACITTIITVYATFNCMEKNYFIVTGDIGEDSRENISTTAAALKDYRKLIDEYYIGEIDEQKLMDATIKGYVNGLDDEYSEYMTKDEWEDYQMNTLGNYVGIGIYMTQDSNGYTVVVEPIANSPAEEAGLLAEDKIVEVDGENVIGKDIEEVSSKVKGEEGTMVRLKIIRGNEYMTIDVERRSIEIYPIQSEIKENNIGYIKLPTFDNNCADNFKNEFEKIKAEGAQKLIIDLRNNTGGIVEEALKIADMIIPKDNKILITVDSKDKKEITKAKQDPIIDMDIIVLVNQYSASATEILAGALKDNKEAKIVGTTTYGKGVIQNVFSFSNGSVLKLTTAEYFTPNETKINKKGIDPDVVVELVDEEEGTEEVDEQLNKALEMFK